MGMISPPKNNRKESSLNDVLEKINLILALVVIILTFVWALN